MDVLVIEARDRVGGRTFTKCDKPNGDGKFWVDLGGSYVGPTQNDVLKLIEELKLETYLVEDTLDIGYLKATKLNNRKCCMLNNNKAISAKGDNKSKIDLRTRFRPDENPKFGNIFHTLDYIHTVKLIDSYGAQIPPEAPWLAPKASEWDAITWKQFIDENTWTKKVRDYFNNIYCCIDVCCEANEISMLWFLWNISQCGGYKRTISTTNGGQERKIKGGTQQLSVGLMNSIGQERVLLGKPVYSIDQTAGPFVQVTTLDGTKFKADYLICAISPHLWLKIHHEPSLPSGKNLLAERSPMGQVSKVILYYERAFWKDHGFSGCFLFDSQDRCSFPVTLSLDETKVDGSHPAVIGFTTSRGWYELRDKSDYEAARLVAKSYAEITKLEEFLNFKHVERYDWTNEQYSGGCYTSTHCPNTLTKFGPYLRQPFGRIYYAGTETAIKWSGYMDGAISAGKRAAREILHIKGNLREEDVWQVEEESVLVPAKPFDCSRLEKYAPSIGGLVNILGHLVFLSGGGLLTFAAYRHLANKW